MTVEPCTVDGMPALRVTAIVLLDPSEADDLAAGIHGEALRAAFGGEAG